MFVVDTINCLSKGKIKTSSEIDLLQSLNQIYHAAHHAYPREKGLQMEANSHYMAESVFTTDVVNLQV